MGVTGYRISEGLAFLELDHQQHEGYTIHGSTERLGDRGYSNEVCLDKRNLEIRIGNLERYGLPTEIERAALAALDASGELGGKKE